MGEYDCRKCSKSFRSERALKFHMESHDEDASMAAWNERRERSRSRIRELSRDRGDSKPSEAEMEFSSRGRARGRAALRDDGVSTSANASIARLDQANDKRLCCKEAGCDRTFQTKEHGSLDMNGYPRTGPKADRYISNSVRGGQIRDKIK